MDPKTFYIGVKGAVRVGDMCLLLHKKGNRGGFWEIPGGRIGAGESVMDTLRRELAEELPSLPTYEVKELLGVYPLGINVGEHGLLFITYKIATTPFEVVLSDEHDAYKWVTKEELEVFVKESDQVLGAHAEALRKAFA